MLAYSPLSLPDIFESLIINFPPTLRNAEPANALYILARFACLTCDYTWLEDLIIGATEAIEECFFVSSYRLFLILALSRRCRADLTISHVWYSGYTIRLCGSISWSVTSRSAKYVKC